MPFQSQYPFFKREESLADNNTVNALLAASGLGGAAGLGHVNNWDVNRFNPWTKEKIKLLFASGFHEDTAKYLADNDITVTKKDMWDTGHEDPETKKWVTDPTGVPRRDGDFKRYLNEMRKYDATYSTGDNSVTQGNGTAYQKTIPLKARIKDILISKLQKHFQPQFRQLTDYNRGSLQNFPNELNQKGWGAVPSVEMYAPKDRYNHWVTPGGESSSLKEYGIGAGNTSTIPNIPVGDNWKGYEHKIGPGNRGKIVVGLGGGWQLPMLLNSHLDNPGILFDEHGGIRADLTTKHLNDVRFKNGILDTLIQGYDKKYGPQNWDMYLPGGPGLGSGGQVEGSGLGSPPGDGKVKPLTSSLLNEYLVAHLQDKYKNQSNLRVLGKIPNNRGQAARELAEDVANNRPYRHAYLPAGAGSIQDLYSSFTDMVFAPGSTSRELSQMRGGLGNLVPLNLPVLGDRSPTQHFGDNSNWLKEKFPELTNVVDMNKPTFHADLLDAISKGHGVDTLRNNYSQVARPIVGHADYEPVRQAIKNKVHMQKFKNLGGLALTAIPGLFGAANLLRNSATGMNA